jgi:hypothetical protein
MRMDLRPSRAMFALVVAGLVSFSTLAPAAGWPLSPPTLNPKKYTSPSGKFVLFVNPSDLHGRGKADYELTDGGRKVWSSEKPYALWDASVTDDGVAAGYAYSHGWAGYAEAGIDAGLGDFRVVIIDPRGQERLNRITKRENSHFPDMAPDPRASGLIMDVANDRLVVRVDDPDINAQSEAWSIYQLSTGKELSTFRPKELMPNPKPARYLMNAKPVKGTPLIVLHWSRYDWEKEQKEGALFTLISQDGKAIWTLELPEDYETGGDEKSDELLTASLRRSGGILGSEQPARFELRFAKDAQRVTFTAVRTAGGNWAVSEVSRRPFIEPVISAPKPAAIPVLSLRPAGRVVLKSDRAAPPPEIREVNDFVFDPQGLIAYVRWSEIKSKVFTVVDQQGKVLHTVPLDAADAESPADWSELTCVGPGRYLLIRENPIDRNKTAVVTVDVVNGMTTPIAGFTTTALSKLGGFTDGGLVVIGGLIYFKGGATGDGSLRSFDGRGKLLGSLPGNGDHNDPAALFGANDLTVTTDGMIAVVDVGRNIVQFFDRSGKHHHTVDLKKAWGREPNYPSDIAADRDGGVVIHDFRGNPPIVRMNADGTIRAQVKPRLKDGRTIDLRDAQVAPDGVLWVSDGHAIYRLLDSGLVGRVLGEAPDPLRLDKATAVTVDGKGQIYAVVARTGAVHVFAADGRWLRVCVPDAGDVARAIYDSNVTVSETGDVFLGLGDFTNIRFLHFSPDGNRVGIETSKLNEITESRYAQPGTARVWVLGYEKVYLIDEKGAVIRTIKRRPDGFWLEHPKTAATAPDGSIAVVSSGHDTLRHSRELAVSLYSPQGEPKLTFTLPETGEWSFPRIAFDGKRLAIAEKKAIVLFDATGKPLGQFEPAPNEDAAWTPFFAPGSRELLLFDGVKTLHRFELP